MLSAAAKILGFAAACVVLMISDASAASCRGFGLEAQADIGGNIATVRRLEHEASDRLNGLDTRPFVTLRDEVKAQQAIIAAKAEVANEDDLNRCRNRTWPIRKICADAAQMLVDVLATLAADPKASFDKPGYAGAIGACERHFDLKSLKSRLRG